MASMKQSGWKGALAIVLLALVSGTAAESPADNDRLRDLMTGYVVALDAGEILGLAPNFLVSHTGESMALSAGLGLKLTAPVLKPPPTATLSLDSAGQCRFRYTVPQAQAKYQDWFGFWELDSLPTDWGPFDAPTVEHKDTTVIVNLVDSHRVGNELEGGRYQGEIAEGYTQVAWEAHTQISNVWDIYLPSALMAVGLASEYRRGAGVAAKGAEATASRADKIFRNLRKVGKNLAKSIAIRGAERIDDTLLTLIGDERTTVSNIGKQNVWVWDIHPPYFTAPGSNSPIAAQTITIEATDFGGARFSRDMVRESLESAFTERDDCARALSPTPQNPPSLLPVSDVGTEVVWTIQDGGPYQVSEINGTLAANQELVIVNAEEDRGNVRTTLTQRVIVQDTQPPILVVPEGFARVADGPVAVGPGGIKLGSVQVVDRADPNPVVENNAPEMLDFGRHLIAYSAYDFSGNTTQAPADDPERYTQIVTIKAPNTNTAPQADSTSAQTRSGEPVAIQLTAQDFDMLGDPLRPDPLRFQITQRPGSGTFQTPPLPYFIEDFRPQPESVPDGTTAETLACLTDEERDSGPALEAKLGLLDVNDHDAYIEKCYCDMPQDRRQVPTDFVYAPVYVHIEDDGDYLVADKPQECNNQVDSRVISELRFSRWRDDVLVAEHRLGASAIGRVQTFDVDALGRIWWNDFTTSLSVRSLDRNFQQWYRNNNGTLQIEVLNVDDDSAPLINPSQVIYAHPDVERGLIYVNDKRRVFAFAMSGNSDREALGTLNDGARVLTECAVTGNSRVGFTMTSDSDGALYVADSCENRVHQFQASSVDTQGALIPGDYVGWLGRCSANLLDPERGVPFNNCDVRNKTSVGFACTDDTCERDNRADRSSGTDPGQFDVITHLNLDPNDVLYVADYDNQRIQRFSAGGAFAGEAVSVGDGVTRDGNFVLGNMGPPRHVSVNGESFHVLETQAGTSDFFLHIFKTLPFRDVTDNSAWVDYVSNPRYLGVDSFSFLVDDGIAVSDPATVTVQVDRNFRPPTDLQAACWREYDNVNLSTPVPCTLAEDTAIFVQLSAQDPDGFIGFDGLDQHSFSITVDPTAGTLTEVGTDVNQAIYRYVPNADYNGTDHFEFQASDGFDEAQEAGQGSLVIDPVQDLVAISFDDSLRFPRGFPQALTAEFLDVDRDPSEDLDTISWDWGDGVVALADSARPWLNIGIRDQDDEPVDPQFNSVPVEGLLLGAHTYDANTNGVTICMLERNTDLQNCATSPPVEVLEVTRVTLARADDNTIAPEQVETVVFMVTNEQPEGWSGIPVNAAELSVALPDGVSLAAPVGGCTGTGPVRCVVDLAVGDTVAIALPLRFALAAAQASPFFVFDLELTGDTPRLEDRNLQTLVVEASDRDQDGTIDVDDAFPDDARYASDADNDRMADSWELQYGLDPANAEDATADLDTDGFSNRQEFLYDGTPLLADAYLKAEQLRLDAGIEDRIGFATASADIDGDGIDDVIMTAPAFSDNGALLIAGGSADGVSTMLDQIDGPLPGFGRSVSAGDLNRDGFADVVVGATDAVLIYFGSADGLSATPAQTLSVPGTDFGAAVLVTDIDADTLMDLLVTQKSASAVSTNAGGVVVYLGNSDYLVNVNPTPSKVIAGNSMDLELGESLAVGLLDDDALPDLMLGSVTDAGSVHGYLGSSFDWTIATHGTPDFVMNGEAGGDQFGFSIASGADLDGDARDDVVVGAYGAGTAGAVYIYTAATTTWSGVPTAAQRIDGTQGSEQFGVRVGLFAERGNRATADLLVGANRGERGDEPDEGTVYFYPGGSLPLSLTQTDHGPAHDMLGYFLQGTADLNGDGRSDALASAPDITVPGWTSDGGFVQVYYGGGGIAQSDMDDDGVADSLDVCPGDADTDQANQDGDGVGDACDAFPDDDRYQNDSDADGMPDRFEQEAGLDPDDPADANQDLDGDGRNNLEEFNQGSDVTMDDVAPVITVPDAVRVTAIGPFTPVQLGTASATDAKDGARTVTNNAPTAFAAGLSQVTWQAADAAGNVAQATQQIEVVPLLEVLGVERGAVEGQMLEIEFELSGAALSYPVIVDYQLTGTATAGSDYTVIDSALTIDNGLRGTLQVALAADGQVEADETLVVTLSGATDAALGPNQQHTVVITEGDVAPRLQLRMTQGGALASTAYQSLGPVELTIAIDDANPDDAHGVDWSATDAALIPAEGPFTERFTFDPQSAEPGLYRIAVTVIDSGNPTEPYALEQLLRIAAAPPSLDASADGDGDGVDDLTEGYGDADQDGLADYLDAENVARWLPAVRGDRGLLQSEPGTRLRLGDTAYASDKAAAVTLTDVADFGDRGGPASGVADGFAFPGGIFDFKVQDVQRPGRSVRVVLPQLVGIPPSASYRKYSPQAGWSAFIENATNQLASAPGAQGVCPAPGSADYRPGLTAGDYCVELLLEDGGANDADGAVNGVVVDPGGVAVLTNVVPTVTAAGTRPPNTNVSTGAQDVLMLRFSLDADSTVTALTQVTLDASGSGNDATVISAVRLWLDRNGDGVLDSGDEAVGSGSYSQDDGTLSLTLTTPMALPLGQSDFMVTYDF